MPSGPEVPTHWVGSCFHIFRISEGAKSTQRKNILTPVVSKLWEPPESGLLCDHWSGSLTWRWPIGPQLPTADFCIKNETPDMKFFEKSSSTYLPHAFARKTNPLFAKNMKFSFGTNFVPLDMKLTPTPVTSGRAQKVPQYEKIFCRRWRRI